MTSERRLDDPVSMLKNVVVNHKKCTLLIGAGCSVLAGIPTAAGFVDEIRKRDPRAYERAAQKTYPHCMAQLPPGARRDLIAELVRPAHERRLRQSGPHGQLQSLVVRVCALMGEFLAVYDLAAS